MALPSLGQNRRGARSVQRIVDAAARMFGRDGFHLASMSDVAHAAGVSKGLLHYHFHTKEHLLIEAVRASFRRIHGRFDERVRQGERGVGPAAEGLDALWASVRDLASFAPFMVETLSLAAKGGPVDADLRAFETEAEGLLVDGIGGVFPDGSALPPDRLARLVRVCLHGLTVELALARTDEERARVDLAYRDLRDLFLRVHQGGSR